MPALTELRPDGTIANGFASGTHTDLADESDGTFLAGAASTAPGTTRFSLGSVPADFLSVDGNLTIVLRAALSAAGDDTWTIRAILCDSAGSTVGYGTSSAALSVSGASPSDFGFTVTGVTANQAAMNAACVELVVTRSQSMGADGNHIRVHRLGVTGNYNSDTVLSSVGDSFHAHTAESPTLSTPPILGFINPSLTENHNVHVVPFTNFRYLATWNTAPGLSGDKRFRLLQATPEEDGWHLGPDITGDMGSVGINSELITWKQSATQVGFMHNRYGSGGNPDNSYAAAAVYNAGTDSVSATAGNLALTAGTGGEANSPHADRLDDTHALLIHRTFSATSGSEQVRGRVGELSGSTDTSYTFGTVFDIGMSRGTTGHCRVAGVSSTRAVVFHAGNDGAGTHRIAAKILGISGTTLSDISGSWTDINTDYLHDLNIPAFSVKYIDASRVLVLYSSQPTQASTDRTLKAVIVDVAGDTITVGTPITLDATTSPLTPSFFIPTAHTAVLSANEILVVSQRSGGSGSYSSNAAATGSGVSSLVIPKAPSVVDGDAMWTFITIDGDNGSVVITPPAGWTHLRSVINSGNVGLHAYYKMASSEGASYTWGFSTPVTCVGSCVRTTSSILDNQTDPGSVAVDATGNSASADAPFILWDSKAVIAVSAVGSAVTHTPPTGYTEQLDQAVGTCAMSIATDTATLAAGQAASFALSASAPWATLHVPIWGETGGPVGYTLDAGASGTTLSLVVGPELIMPARYQFNNWDYGSAYPTTENTPHKAVSGAYYFYAGSSGGSNINQGVGFWDVPQLAGSAEQTISDAADITDAVSAAATLSQAVGGWILDELGDPVLDEHGNAVTAGADPVGLTDAIVVVSGAAPIEKSQTDPVGLTDSIVVIATAVRSSSDNVGLLDTRTQAAAAARTATDNLGLLDSANLVATLSRSNTDTIGLLDAVARTATISRAITDAVDITEGVTSAELEAQTYLELIGLLDSMAPITTSARAPPDEPIGITDSTTVELALIATDTVGLSDTATKAAVLSRKAPPASASTIAYRGASGIVSSAASQTVAIVPPTNVQPGDLVIAVVWRTAHSPSGVNLESTSGLVPLREQSVAFGGAIYFALFIGFWQRPGYFGFTYDDSTVLVTAEDEVNIGNAIFTRTYAFSGVDQTSPDIEGAVSVVGDNILTFDASGSSAVNQGGSMNALAAFSTRITPVAMDAAASWLATGSFSGWTFAGIASAAAGAVAGTTDLAHRTFTAPGSVSGWARAHNSSSAAALAESFVLLPDPWDTAGITDSTTRVVSSQRSPVDTVGLTDSIHAVVTNDRDFEDPVSVVDSVTAALETTLSDSIGILDAAESLSDSVRVPDDDTVGLTDTFTQVGANLGASSDPIGITDSIAAEKAQTRTLDDAIGITEGGGTFPVTFKVNGDGTGGAFQPRNWTVQNYLNIDEDFGSPDGSSITGPLSSGGDTSFQLVDTPADFASMAELSVRIRMAIANRVDDNLTIFVRVVDPDTGTILAGGGQSDSFLLLGLNTSSVHGNYGPFTFSVLATSATKAQWDRAVLVFRQGYAPVGGGDAFTAYVVDAIELAGSYSLAGGTSQVSGSARTDDDTIGITDQIAVAQDHVASLTDNLGLTDQADTDQALVVTDTVGTTDSTSTDLTVELADTIGILDTPALDTATQITDLLGITDTAGLTQTTVRAVTDTVPLDDFLQNAGELDATILDTVGVTDQALRTTDANRNHTDLIGITDDAAAAQDHNRTVTDQVGITDQITVVQAHAAEIIDALEIADETVQIAAHSVSLFDQIELSDALAPAGQLDATILSPVGIIDNAGATSVTQRVTTDPVNVTDDATTAATVPLVVADAVGITDQATHELTVGSTDHTATVTDTLGITDQALTAPAVTVTVTDPVGLTDTAARTASTQVTVADLVAITDPLADADVADRSLLDLIGITDTVTSGRVIEVEVTDTVAVTDTPVSALGHTAVLTDQIGLTDTWALQQDHNPVIVDPVTTLDLLSIEAEFYRIVDDLIGLTDEVVNTTSTSLIVEVGDPVGITDSATSDVFIATVIRFVLALNVQERSLGLNVQERTLTSTAVQERALIHELQDTLLMREEPE
jgi:hypothetical protein